MIRRPDASRRSTHDHRTYAAAYDSLKYLGAGIRSGGHAVWIVLLIVSLSACTPIAQIPTAAPRDSGTVEDGPPETASERGRVQRVVDGDSLIVDGRDVRLIGINAPERGDAQHVAAREHLRSLVDGETVYLERDVERRDQYGRELAYVYRDDGTFVNHEMLRAGYAQAYTVPPNVLHALVAIQAEMAARESGSGLWARSELPLEITHLQHDAPGRDEENPGGEWIEIENTGRVAVALENVSIRDEANNVYVFADGDLGPGQVVRVHSGRGDDAPGRRFWGESRAIWNNGGDAAILRDPEGRFIDIWRYEGRPR